MWQRFLISFVLPKIIDVVLEALMKTLEKLSKKTVSKVDDNIVMTIHHEKESIKQLLLVESKRIKL